MGGMSRQREPARGWEAGGTGKGGATRSRTVSEGSEESGWSREGSQKGIVGTGADWAVRDEPELRRSRFVILTPTDTGEGSGASRRVRRPSWCPLSPEEALALSIVEELHRVVRVLRLPKVKAEGRRGECGGVMCSHPRGWTFVSTGTCCHEREHRVSIAWRGERRGTCMASRALCPPSVGPPYGAGVFRAPGEDDALGQLTRRIHAR